MSGSRLTYNYFPMRVMLLFFFCSRIDISKCPLLSQYFTLTAVTCHITSAAYLNVTMLATTARRRNLVEFGPDSVAGIVMLVKLPRICRSEGAWRPWVRRCADVDFPRLACQRLVMVDFLVPAKSRRVSSNKCDGGCCENDKSLRHVSCVISVTLGAFAFMRMCLRRKASCVLRRQSGENYMVKLPKQAGLL